MRRRSSDGTCQVGFAVKLLSKPGNAQFSAEPQLTGDPYTDGRGVWMERYGTYVQQAYNWRLVAMLQAIALVVAVAGIIYLASQTKFVPYVVAIDKIGSAIAVAPADRASPVDQRVVRAELARWIVNSRSVVTDRIVTLKTLDSVYAFVAPNSAAMGYINEWYSAPGHSPLERAKKETDQVAISAILPISSSTYELQWTETLRDEHGAITEKQDWDGSATIAFTPPATEAGVVVNPLGLYITALNWTKKI
jgi:type IV secretion system protein VirB5